MLKKVLCALVMFPLVACGGPEASEPLETAEVVASPATTSPKVDVQTEAETFTVVMLGDSLTAGFGLAAEFALPEQTETRLREAGFDVTFVNAGVSGDTTGGGLARYDWSVASADPEMLIVALGANDYLQGQTPERARENLSAIIERGLDDGLVVLLVSVGARSDEINDPRAAAFAEIYPALASEFGVPHLQGMLSDIRSDADLLLPDGLHPTAEGIGLVADRLSVFVAENLPQG
ncbi:MAG: GDSL-type esterase/lipase family protein [Pseudomonadota bacterium]